MVGYSPLKPQVIVVLEPQNSPGLVTDLFYRALGTNSGTVRSETTADPTEDKRYIQTERHTPLDEGYDAKSEKVNATSKEVELARFEISQLKSENGRLKIISQERDEEMKTLTLKAEAGQLEIETLRKTLDTKLKLPRPAEDHSFKTKVDALEEQVKMKERDNELIRDQLTMSTARIRELTVLIEERGKVATTPPRLVEDDSLKRRVSELEEQVKVKERDNQSIRDQLTMSTARIRELGSRKYRFSCFSYFVRLVVYFFRFDAVV